MDLNNKKLIGTLADGSKVFDYGSKFFAISDKGEILEKSFNVISKEPLKVLDIITCERYEYLDDVSYTHRDDYSISAVLDLDNISVKGNRIDFLNDTINDESVIYCSTVDYVDFDNDDAEYSTLLQAVRIIYEDDSIDDLSILDSDEEAYISLAILGDTCTVFSSNESSEHLYSFSFNEDLDERETELTYCFMLGVERLAFDSCSLLSLESIENRETFDLIKYINGITLKDKGVTQVNIAEVLEMNYKVLSASPQKEMYINLYKQKLIDMLLSEES